MEPMQEEVIAALQKDEWALAIEVLATIEAFAEPRYALQEKYELDVRDLQRLALLPAFEFKRFKRDAIRAVERRLHTINHDLYQRLCVELNYCDRRDMPQARLISYLIGILDIIFGSGAIALAVLIAKREYLDKVCNCPRVRPNNAFKPKLHRYAVNMAEKACHVASYALQFGLT